MITLFYTGRNDENVSGVSWKVWKIAINNRTIVKKWGPIKIVKRKIIPVYLQQKEIVFRTIELAQKFYTTEIKKKINKGYERKPRRNL